MRITESEIMAARTEKGGWTRAQLEEWGVPWIGKSPPKGWKRQLLKYGVPYQAPERMKAKSPEKARPKGAAANICRCGYAGIVKRTWLDGRQDSMCHSCGRAVS